jgi:hypothetical protein
LLSAVNRKLAQVRRRAPRSRGLWSTPPRDAENYRLHEIFIKTPHFRNYASVNGWEERREELLEHLHRRVFGALPPTSGVPQARSIGRVGGGAFEGLEITTEAGIQVRALIGKPKEQVAVQTSPNMAKLLLMALKTAADATERQVRGEASVAVSLTPRD